MLFERGGHKNYKYLDGRRDIYRVCRISLIMSVSFLGSSTCLNVGRKLI
jgi:hypothetical protein